MAPEGKDKKRKAPAPTIATAPPPKKSKQTESASAKAPAGKAKPAAGKKAKAPVAESANALKTRKRAAAELTDSEEGGVEIPGPKPPGAAKLAKENPKRVRDTKPHGIDLEEATVDEPIADDAKPAKATRANKKSKKIDNVALEVTVEITGPKPAGAVTLAVQNAKELPDGASHGLEVKVTADELVSDAAPAKATRATKGNKKSKKSDDGQAQKPSVKEAKKATVVDTEIPGPKPSGAVELSKKNPKRVRDTKPHGIDQEITEDESPAEAAPAKATKTNKKSKKSDGTGVQEPSGKKEKQTKALDAEIPGPKPSGAVELSKKNPKRVRDTKPHGIDQEITEDESPAEAAPTKATQAGRKSKKLEEVAAAQELSKKGAKQSKATDAKTSNEAPKPKTKAKDSAHTDVEVTELQSVNTAEKPKAEKAGKKGKKVEPVPEVSDRDMLEEELEPEITKPAKRGAKKGKTDESVPEVDDVTKPEPIKAADKASSNTKQADKAGKKSKKVETGPEIQDGVVVEDEAEREAVKSTKRGGKKGKVVEPVSGVQDKPKPETVKTTDKALNNTKQAKKSGKKGQDAEPVPGHLEHDLDLVQESDDFEGFNDDAADDNVDDQEDEDEEDEEDQTDALLEGFDSEGEDPVQEDVGYVKNGPLPPMPKDKKTVKKIEDAKKAKADTPGAVYVGRIPHGFYEGEMRGYFSQFGEITKLRLSRNRKTGASKHFAFIEFASDDVAQVVAEAMDSYLMFGHILKCKYVSIDSLPPNVWEGANRRFKKVPWNKIEKRALEKPKTKEQWEKKNVREQKKRDGKAEQMKSMGYEFEMPKLKHPDTVPMPVVEASDDAQLLEEVSSTTVVEHKPSTSVTITQVTKSKKNKGGKGKKDEDVFHDEAEVPTTSFTEQLREKAAALLEGTGLDIAEKSDKKKKGKDRGKQAEVDAPESSGADQLLSSSLEYISPVTAAPSQAKQAVTDAAEKGATTLGRAKQSVMDTAEMGAIAVGQAKQAVTDTAEKGATAIGQAKQAITDTAEQGAATLGKAKQSVTDTAEQGVATLGKAKQSVTDTAEQGVATLGKAKQSVTDTAEQGVAALGKAKQAITDAAEKGAKSLGQAKQTVTETAEQGAASLGQAQQTVKNTAVDTAKKGARSLGKAKQTVTDAATSAAETGATSLGQAQQSVMDAATSAAETGAGALGQAKQTVTDTATETAKKGAANLGQAQQTVTDVATSAAETGATTLGQAQQSIKNATASTAKKGAKALSHAQQAAADTARQVATNLDQTQQAITDTTASTAKNGAEAIGQAKEAVAGAIEEGTTTLAPPATEKVKKGKKGRKQQEEETALTPVIFDDVSPVAGLTEEAVKITDTITEEVTVGKPLKKGKAIKEDKQKPGHEIISTTEVSISAEVVDAKQLSTLESADQERVFADIEAKMDVEAMAKKAVQDLREEVNTKGVKGKKEKKTVGAEVVRAEASKTVKAKMNAAAEKAEAAQGGAKTGKKNKA